MEKIVIVLLIIAIILSIVSIAITLNIDVNNIKLSSGESLEGSNTGTVSLVVEERQGGANE